MAKSPLQEIYKGSFKDRVNRFDDGGSAYMDYDAMAGADQASPYSTYNAQNGPTAAEIAAITGASSPTNGGINSYGVNNGIDATTIGAAPSAQTVAVEGGSGGSGGSSSSGSSAAGGALGALLKALGIGGNATGAVTALGGILGAAGAYQQNKAYAPKYNPPALFGGAAGSTATGAAGAANGTQYGPNGGYNFSNYAGANGAGLGYAPRSQMAPTIPNYYTYGQQPQASFFTGASGAAPAATPSLTPPALVNMKRGGSVRMPSTPQRFAVGGIGVPNIPQTIGSPVATMGGPIKKPMMAQRGMPQQPVAGVPRAPNAAIRPQGPMMRASGGSSSLPQTNSVSGAGLAQWLANSRKAAMPPRVPISNTPTQAQPAMAGGGALSAVSRHVKGPGDGTSDDIPARLANGEYVMDAQTVSMLGNGDNGAGAKQLDKFREGIRKHKGAALAKGKMAPDAKDPQAYLPRGER